MNVILLQDVEKLGVMGAKVKVKDGYARNYLLPQKLAAEATPAAMKLLEKKIKEHELAVKKEKEESQALSSKLQGLSLTLAMEAGEGDKLYGSVTSEMIVESLLAEGHKVDKRKVILGEPIKALGVYDVEIKLHSEIKTQIRVWVIKK
ncbi:MAG: 50S ribosomal protein L9 [Candidatus Omnitrophica bacterium]|nr:50S ribosomal protein L9 [Candidatus Omnitrophota bacterium]